MVVKFFQENHSEPHSIERLCRLVSEESKRGTILRQEALPMGGIYTAAGIMFSNGAIDFDKFWSVIDLGSHWAPPDNYKPLYKTARETGIEIRGLDQPKDIRTTYSSRFLNWTGEARRPESLKHIRKLSDRFLLLRKWLVDAREKWFADVVAADLIHPEASGKDIIVITHPVHVSGVIANLAAKNINKVYVPDYLEEERIENGKREDEIQRIYAKDQNLVELRRGPLVPAVVAAFDEKEKFDAFASRWTKQY